MGVGRWEIKDWGTGEENLELRSNTKSLTLSNNPYLRTPISHLLMSTFPLKSGTIEREVDSRHLWQFILH